MICSLWSIFIILWEERNKEKVILIQRPNPNYDICSFLFTTSIILSIMHNEPLTQFYIISTIPSSQLCNCSTVNRNDKSWGPFNFSIRFSRLSWTPLGSIRQFTTHKLQPNTNWKSKQHTSKKIISFIRVASKSLQKISIEIFVQITNKCNTKLDGRK